MNFERQHLAALDALIVALGGVVPVAVTPNYQVAHLLRLVAVVNATGGVLPAPTLNYSAAVLAHWRAAIAARGGVVPTVFSNFSQAVLLHVQAFGAALGVSTAIAGNNFETAMLGLLPAVIAAADVLAYVVVVQSIAGSVGTPARNLLNTAFATIYNGLRYYDYKAKLRFFWCPLSDFAGIRAPIKGGLFTNSGYVSGNYNLTQGLTNASLKSLRTGVLANAEAANNTTLMIGNNGGSYAAGWLIGGGNVGSFVGLATVLATSYNQADNTEASSDGLINYSMSANGSYFATRNSSTNFTLYRNETLVKQRTGSNNIGSLAAKEIYVGAANYDVIYYNTTIMDCASYGQALTRDEEISFSRMLSAIRTGRATL